MDDKVRLKIAAKNMAVMMGNDPWRAWAPIAIARDAVVMADALLAAAGEEEPCVKQVSYAAYREVTEAIIADLKAQLTAVLADNERLRGVVVSRAEYDRQVAESECLRELVESGAAEIASLKRQLEPLTEEEAHTAWVEWDGTGHHMMSRYRAIMAVKARRGE